MPCSYQSSLLKFNSLTEVKKSSATKKRKENAGQGNKGGTEKQKNGTAASKSRPKNTVNPIKMKPVFHQNPVGSQVHCWMQMRNFLTDF